MSKKLFLIFPLILLLLVGCALDKDTEPSGTVRLTIEDISTSTRSILPEYPEIKGYKIILDCSKKVEKSFKPGESIVFDNIPIGTCDISVEAYSDESLSNMVAEGASTLLVRPDSENNVSVALDWLSDGYGSFTVDFSWDALTNKDNPIAEAIERGSLGFMAWDKNDSKAYADASIQWADATKTSYTYTQNNVPTTRNRRSENVSFRIYSKVDGKEQVIAETFYTSVSILPNITSKEDGAESFAFSDNNITYYLKNITDATWKMNETDSGSMIDVTWKYPLLSDGSYKVTVWVTNSSKSNEVVGNKQTFNYTVSGGIATGETATTLSGLEPGNIYCLHFLNETNGTTSETYRKSADITPFTDIKTKVKVSSIAFTDDFKTTYVMGDSVTVPAVILPDNATYKDYTVTATEGVNVKEKAISFPTSGDYTITLTSEDADAVTRTAEKTVTVKLSKPQDFTLEKTETGVKLGWTAVESATGYRIEKTYNGVTENLTTTETSYTDVKVSTGIDYTYKVKAVREDSKFDSDYSEEKTAKLSNVMIYITLPAKIESINNSKLLSDALSGKYVTDIKGFTVDIGDAISKEYTYSWYLNGVKVGDDNAKSVNIDKDTKGLIISTTESSNTLQLNVTKGDYTYSASATFHYIETDPGEVTITGPEKVVYGTPVTFTATTQYNNKAVIIWSSSDPSIATVDSDGKVTSLLDGTVDITATAVATGASKTVSVKSYIPVKSVSFKDSLKSRWLVAQNNGVKVTDGNYTTIDLAKNVTIEAMNGVKASDVSLTWSLDEGSGCVALNGSTLTTDGKSNYGTPKITVKAADGQSASISIPVYKFEIYHGSTPVTGGSSYMKGSASYPKNYVYIYVNGKKLADSSTSSQLKSLTSYGWSFDAEQSSSFEKATHDYYAEMSFGWNALKCIVTVTINGIGTMSFTRTG